MENMVTFKKLNSNHMNEKTQQLLNRTFLFGVNVLKFLKSMPEDNIYKIPKIQVARSSLSIGANYEEAQGAVSKRDFKNKIGTSYKESRETVYWLRVLEQLYPDNKYKTNFVRYLTEAQEIKNIFAAIKKSASG
jgi:four helix bundle protein